MGEDSQNKVETNSDGQHRTDGTRRRFLRQISAIGGAFALSKTGIGRVEATPTERATISDVRTALDDEKVQSLLDALDSPRVLAQRAAVRSANIKNRSMEITVVPTVAGNIVHGSPQHGETEALFRFESVRARGQLPEQYRSLPNADSAILKGLDDGVVLTRLATNRERSAMVEHLDCDPQNVIAYTSSEKDVFTLKYLDSDDAIHTYAVEGASIYTESEVTAFSYRKVTPESSELTTTVDCSTDWCWRCVMAAGGCGACVASCSAVGPGCALCLMALCGASGYACSACVDCNI